jgi:adenine phosphoribosyltransferase
VIPYYPFKGVDRFYDIGGLLMHPPLMRRCIDLFADRYRGKPIDKIGGLDARGFILGPPIAMALDVPFFMLRKKGKLPNAVTGGAYSKVGARVSCLALWELDGDDWQQDPSSLGA